MSNKAKDRTEQHSAANSLRESLPDDGVVAHGIAGVYGLDWLKLSPVLRGRFERMGRTLNRMLSGAYAKNPSLLRDAQAAHTSALTDCSAMGARADQG